MPTLEEILIANVQESVNFDTVLKRATTVQRLSARLAEQIMFNPDTPSRAAAIQTLEGQIVDHFDSEIIPQATALGRTQAQRIIRQIGGGRPVDINNPAERRRILFGGSETAAQRLQIVQRLVNDAGNTLDNRLGALWLEPGRDDVAKLELLRRLHLENEERRQDFEMRLEVWERGGRSGRRPATPRLEYLSKFTQNATQNVREQGRRVGTEAETEEFQRQGFDLFTWVTVNAGDACVDCRKRQGTTGTMAFFDEIGRPGSGATVCGPRCFCLLVPKETIYHAPGLARGVDVPGADPVHTSEAQQAAIDAQKIVAPAAAAGRDPKEAIKAQVAGDEATQRVVADVADIARRAAPVRRQLEKQWADTRAAAEETAAAERVERFLTPAAEQSPARLAELTRAARAAAAAHQGADVALEVHRTSRAAEAHAAMFAPPDKRFDSVKGIPVDAGGGAAQYRDPRTSRAAREAEAFIARIVARPPELTRTLPKLRVTYNELSPGGRPYYSGEATGGDPALNEFGVVPTAGPRAIVHQWGHELEARIPGAPKAARAFLDMRTAGERPKQLSQILPDSGFRPDEVGRDDQFGLAFGAHARYVGREYGPASTRTEILSMGLELLFADPIRFVEADPEFVAFILGVLHGRVGL
jgi:hypothetical protein